jgi:hypothetical protein
MTSPAVCYCVFRVSLRLHATKSDYLRGLSQVSSFATCVALPYLTSFAPPLLVSSTTAADSQSSQIGKSEDKAADRPGDVAARGDITKRTTPPPPHLSDTESRLYYYGLPSSPTLVARTGSTPWEEPTGPSANPREKELGVVGTHDIREVWENLLPEICGVLDKEQVEFTSIDLVRIGYADEGRGPVVVWIGTKPDSPVSYEIHYDTAVKCKQLLIDCKITDVEIEMRRSKIFRSTPPARKDMPGSTRLRLVD